MAHRPAVPAFTPPRAGVGLRSPHIDAIVASLPAVGWLEVHAENYMGGGWAADLLDHLRPHYPIALHAVGLSLGSAQGLSREHLARLKALVDRQEPLFVSEHLSWSVAGDVYFNDLLPLPYTEESLAVLARNVDQAQDSLGRELLVENPSSYLAYRHSTIAEPEFLTALVERTGCGLLCDVNNVYVSAVNLGFSPEAYIDAVPRAAVKELHLAGHHRTEADGAVLLIDDHGSQVVGEVWQLYRRALARFGPVPTLIEWDSQLPELDVLVAEARAADRHASAALAEVGA